MKIPKNFVQIQHMKQFLFFIFDQNHREYSILKPFENPNHEIVYIRNIIDLVLFVPKKQQQNHTIGSFYHIYHNKFKQNKTCMYLNKSSFLFSSIIGLILSLIRCYMMLHYYSIPTAWKLENSFKLHSKASLLFKYFSSFHQLFFLQFSP